VRIVGSVTALIIETSEGVRLRTDIAGAGSRYAAGLIDFLLICTAALLIGLVLAIVSAIARNAATDLLGGLFVGGAFLIAASYSILFHAFMGGRTPGKSLLRIRVVAADGRPASFLALLLRGVIQPIDYFAAYIGVILIAATPRHQRLGDLVAGTLVIHDQRRRTVTDPFFGQTWSGLAQRTLPLTPGLEARLSPDDRAFLRELVTREGLADDARRRLFIEAARAFSAKLELGPFMDARVFLKELYLFVREMAVAKPT
jgi:uncharacterized RDD family membrane protein YckC